MNESVKDKLQHYDDIMRETIQRALSKIDKPHRDLIACLHSDNLTLRHTAAQILGEQADQQAITHLMRALDDDSGEVRRAAAWALGQIGDARAVPGLIRALRDTDNRPSWVVTAEFLEPSFDVDGRFREEKRVCDIAADALARIGTPSALKAVVAWRNGYEID